MIFAEMSDEESFKLLKKSGSNWLIKETKILGVLVVNYINASDALANFYIRFTDGDWECFEDKVDDLKNSFSLDLNLHNIESSRQDLIDSILNHFQSYNMAAHEETKKANFDLSTIKIIWIATSGILLLPEGSQRSENASYNGFFERANSFEQEEYNLTIEIDHANWQHKISLITCIHDKNLYPVLHRDRGRSLLINNSSMMQIRQELIKLPEGGTPNIPENLQRHPYYRNLVDGLNYRLSRINDELRAENIIKNKEAAIEFTKDEYINSPPSMEQRQVLLATVAQPTKEFFFSQSLKGGRNYQEDRTFVLSDIKLNELWHGCYSELLMLTLQRLVAEVHQKFPTESQEQAIGTTATLAFIINHQIYLAWLGDSPAILVGQETRYLFWPHNSNIKLARVLEKGRVKDEGGAFVRKPNPKKSKDKKEIEKMPKTLNKSLMVIRAIGDNCNAFGHGVSNIPSIVVEDLTESSPDSILVLCSDGLTGLLTLHEIKDICQKNIFEHLADALCNAALANAKAYGKAADNITATVIAVAGCQNPTLAAVFDGHGFASKGHLIAEFANNRMPEIFKELAEKLAPLKEGKNSRSKLKRAKKMSEFEFFKKNTEKKQKTTGETPTTPPFDYVEPVTAPNDVQLTNR